MGTEMENERSVRRFGGPPSLGTLHGRPARPKSMGSPGRTKLVHKAADSKSGCGLRAALGMPAARMAAQRGLDNFPS
jgi:hypothetical protein